MNKNFKIHIPVELIKGKDDKGNTIMKMRGIASSPSLDADGEYLDPKGFESDYFLKHGFMNWNHQTNNDPSAIVGRPTSADVVKKDYVIGFNLFPESKKAKQIFELQQVLETQGLALGLSIEGKVLERDPKNKAKVTKAMITGCAITPNPKNRDTVAEIIKGNSYTALVDTDEEDEDDAFEKEKALSASSASGRAIAKESLNDSLKVLTYNKKIKKGEVLEKISRDLPLLNKEMVSTVYDLTKKIQKAMDNAQTENNLPEVTAETLEKAYKILGLVEDKKEVVIEEIEKGESPKAIEDMNEQELADHKVQLQKSIDSIDTLQKGEEVEEEVLTEDEIEKGMKMYKMMDGSHKKMTAEEYKKYEKEMKDKNYDPKMKDKNYKEDMKKADDVVGAPKVEDNAVVKALSTIFKGEIASITEANNEKFKAVGMLVKGFQEQVAELTGKVGTMADESPGAKSITSEQVLKKSFDGEDENKDNYVSIKQNKSAIAKALTDDFFAQDTQDESFRKSLLRFDQAGEADAAIIAKAKEIGMTLVP